MMIPPRARLPRSPQKAPPVLTDSFPSQSIASAAVAAAVARSTFEYRTPPPRDPGGHSSATEDSTAHRHARSNRRYSATRSTTKRLNVRSGSPVASERERKGESVGFRDGSQVKLPYDLHGCDEFTVVHGCYAERLGRSSGSRNTNAGMRLGSRRGSESVPREKQSRDSGHRLRGKSASDATSTVKRTATVYEEALASVAPAILEAAHQESRRKQRSSDAQRARIRDAQSLHRRSVASSSRREGEFFLQSQPSPSSSPSRVHREGSRSVTHRKKPQRVSSALFDSLHETNVSQDSSAEAFRQTVRDLSSTTRETSDDPALRMETKGTDTKQIGISSCSPGKESGDNNNNNVNDTTLSEQTVTATTISDDSVDSAFPVVVCTPCESTTTTTTDRASDNPQHRNRERPTRQDPSSAGVCFPFYVRIQTDPISVDIEPMGNSQVKGMKPSSVPNLTAGSSAQPNPATGACAREVQNHRNRIELEPWLLPRKQPKPLPQLWSNDEETPSVARARAPVTLWSSESRDERFFNQRYDNAAEPQRGDSQLPQRLRYGHSSENHRDEHPLLEPPSWISGFVFLRPHAAAAPLPLRPFQPPHIVRSTSPLASYDEHESTTGIQTAHLVAPKNGRTRLEVEGQRFHTLIPTCWVDEFTRRSALRRVLHAMLRRSKERRATRHWRQVMQHKTIVTLMNVAQRKRDLRVAAAIYASALRTSLIRRWCSVAANKQRKRDALRVLRAAAGIDVPPLIH